MYGVVMCGVVMCGVCCAASGVLTVLRSVCCAACVVRRGACVAARALTCELQGVKRRGGRYCRFSDYIGCSYLRVAEESAAGGGGARSLAVGRRGNPGIASEPRRAKNSPRGDPRNSAAARDGAEGYPSVSSRISLTVRSIRAQQRSDARQLRMHTARVGEGARGYPRVEACVCVRVGARAHLVFRDDLCWHDAVGTRAEAAKQPTVVDEAPVPAEYAPAQNGHQRATQGRAAERRHLQQPRGAGGNGQSAAWLWAWRVACGVRRCAIHTRSSARSMFL